MWYFKDIQLFHSEGFDGHMLCYPYPLHLPQNLEIHQWGPFHLTQFFRGVRTPTLRCRLCTFGTSEKEKAVEKAGVQVGQEKGADDTDTSQGFSL